MTNLNIMKTKRLFTVFILALSFLNSFGQVPSGFNYQAIARDGSGNILSNLALPVKIAFTTSLGGGSLIYEEQFTSVTTNQFGLISLVIGTGTQSGGTAASFSAIDWKAQQLYITTSIKYPGTQWTTMGSSQLWSVPYSLVAKDIGPLTKLGINGNTTNMEEALFEVKNITGQTVFAVYNEGVRIWVDDGAKGVRGGFSVGGYDMSKGVKGEYFRVTGDSTRIYVKPQPQGKGLKGGFSVGGYDASKAGGGPETNYLNVTPDNYFIGTGAGRNNSTGQYNSFLGYYTGYSNSTGGQNVFVGHQSGYGNKTGSANVMVGNYSGYKIVDGTGNTFVGTGAGQNASGGKFNLFLGPLTGNKNNADNNIFLGYSSGYNNTIGTNNLFGGVGAGFYNRKGSGNIYLGNLAGGSDTIGSFNIFMGESSGLSNQASKNIMMGYQTGYHSLSGDNNIFMGYQTGYNNNLGSENAFMGYQSGFTNTSGKWNVFIGNMTGYSNTSGGSNIFLGYQSGYYNTIGFQNVFFGTQTGVNNTVGNNNIFLGTEAGQYNTSGEGNVYVGLQAGAKNTTGMLNVALGYLAGFSSVNGSNSVFIGSNAGYYETLSGRLYISNSAADKNNALIYGEFDNKNVTINGNLGIGKTSPGAKLDITGGSWDLLNGEGDFRIGDGSYRLKMGIANAGGGAGDARINAHGGTNRLILGSNGKDILLVTQTTVQPWTDNVTSLGAAGARWTAVYAANGTIQTSDLRLKENIADLTYGIQSLMQLRPVSYTWKNSTDNKEHLGLIAQDVEKVINEVVDKGSDPLHTLGLNYSELVPVLIKSIQDQQKQIDELRKTVQELKSALGK
jgi:trimeric autotransporter adhesin